VADASEPDDLKALTGVGPALERKLRKAGYASYAEIGALDRAGIDALAERVGTTAELIRRERWVASAKRLHRAKYGERL
jgi:predicted flap endonuclease-1-like 5' DNA nuclease